jgi:hypothetical protein
MAKTPKEVFQVFDLERLQNMAEHIDIDYADKTKKQLVTELSAHVSSLGLSLMLKEQKLKVLKEVAKLCDWDDERPQLKGTIAKKIQETMEEQNPKKFLKKVDTTILQKFLEALRVDLSNISRKDYVELILQNTDEIGMEYCFSSFPTSKLKEFLKFCKLKVDSDNSQYTIIRALIEQESIIAPYEPASGEHPSKNKPQIDSQITNVDLYTHYFKEDLSDWCFKKGLISNGSKKELVERIRRSVDEKTEKRDLKKPRRTAAKKQSEEDEEEDKNKELEKVPEKEKVTEKVTEKEKRKLQQQQQHQSELTNDEPKQKKKK